MVEPVILELAVNGATPRHRNRHVPRTPAEITEAHDYDVVARIICEEK